MKTFIENKLWVHLVAPNIGGEFTMCGDSFDIAESEKDYPHGSLKPTNKKVVTCAECARVINHCKGVRVKTLSEDEQKNHLNKEQ